RRKAAKLNVHACTLAAPDQAVYEPPMVVTLRKARCHFKLAAEPAARFPEGDLVPTVRRDMRGFQSGRSAADHKHRLAAFCTLDRGRGPFRLLADHGIGHAGDRQRRPVATETALVA